MKIRHFFTAGAFLVFAAGALNAQTGGKTRTTTILPLSEAKINKSSPAYAELILRKTERAAELEDLLVDYTEEFPKVKTLQFEINLINSEIKRVLTVSPAEAGKLTLALGKLMLRKIELEIDYSNLQTQYKDEHPEVKQAKRKVEIFEAAIKDILQ